MYDWNEPYSEVRPEMPKTSSPWFGPLSDSMLTPIAVQAQRHRREAAQPPPPSLPSSLHVFGEAVSEMLRAMRGAGE
jgi:hypothetical protein